MMNSPSSSDENGDCWISRYCSRPGNEFLCEVEKEFLRDFSNLVGLDEEVAYFPQALDIILDEIGTIQDDMSKFAKNPQQYAMVEKTRMKAAETLYGLVHARYILTERGCGKMLDKYLQGQFGYCPRVFCDNSYVLPIGLTDTPGEDTVKIYCPKCEDVYSPRLAKHKVDGAFFGTSFPHMLFMIFSDYRPQPCQEFYVPRLYGFKIHPSAYLAKEKDSKEKRNIQENGRKIYTVQKIQPRK